MSEQRIGRSEEEHASAPFAAATGEGRKDMKTVRLSFLVLVPLLLCLSCSAQKKELTGAEIYDDLMQKAQQVESYKVDSKTVMKMHGEDMTTTSHTEWKKPGLLHTSRDMPGGMKQEMYQANGVIWTYMPSMKMATKMDMSKIRGDMPGQPDLGKSLTSMLKGVSPDAIASAEKKVVDGNEVYLFRVSPETGQTSPHKKSPLPPHNMEFLMYADNGLPYKMTVTGKDGKVVMEQTYSNYQVNVDIPDSEFEFTPPKGVQVTDMSEAAMHMMNQMKGHGTRPPMPPQTPPHE